MLSTSLPTYPTSVNLEASTFTNGASAIFANRLAEPDGLARIDFALTPYRGAAEQNCVATKIATAPAPPVSTNAGIGKTALAYFHSNLYPPRSGAHRRCLSLLQGLKTLGYDVTLVSCNLFTDQPWSDESVIGLEREQGIHAKIYYATAADREYVAQTQARSGLWGMHTPPGLVNFFRQLGRELSPSVVLVNYAYCAELADGPEFAAATRVVEMHDLVSLSGPMAGLAWGQLGPPPYALKSAPPAFLEETFFTKQGLTVDLIGIIGAEVGNHGCDVFRAAVHQRQLVLLFGQ